MVSIPSQCPFNEPPGVLSVCTELYKDHMIYSSVFVQGPYRVVQEHSTTLLSQKVLMWLKNDTCPLILVANRGNFLVHYGESYEGVLYLHTMNC